MSTNYEAHNKMFSILQSLPFFLGPTANSWLAFIGRLRKQRNSIQITNCVKWLVSCSCNGVKTRAERIGVSATNFIDFVSYHDNQDQQETGLPIHNIYHTQLNMSTSFQSPCQLRIS